MGPGKPGEGKVCLGWLGLCGPVIALLARGGCAFSPAAGADEDGRFPARFAEPGGRGGSRASKTLPAEERGREQRGRNRLGDSAGSGDLGPARPRGQVSLSVGRQGRREGGRGGKEEGRGLPSMPEESRIIL